MQLKTMYPAGNSASLQLTEEIAPEAAEIPVTGPELFPAAPNYATIDDNNEVEVILYGGVDPAGRLTGCLRGQSGTRARRWEAGTEIYHSWTADNANAIMDNITAHHGATAFDAETHGFRVKGYQVQVFVGTGWITFAQLPAGWSCGYLVRRGITWGDLIRDNITWGDLLTRIEVED